MVDVSMHYYGFCIYFLVTIWNCMDIVDYLDCAGHVMLIVMFVVVALDYIMMSLFVTVDAPKTRETLANFFCESLIILHC